MSDSTTPVSTSERPDSMGAIVAAIGLVLGGLALVVWFGSRPAPPIDHWKEVARAREFLGRGRPDLAFRAVEGIRDEAPGAAEALTLAAQSLLTLGDISTARRALERSIKLQPAQPEAHKMLAAIYLASGDGARGLELLKTAAKLDPKDFRPWYAMGKVHHDLGELAESADAYAEALKRSPPAAERAESMVGQIRALLDANRIDEGEAEIVKARALLPDHPQILGLAARAAGTLVRRDDALALASRALELDPENFDAYLARATVRHLNRDPRGALADLEQATRINPNHLGALQLLAQVQSLLGKSADAEATRTRFRRASDRVALMDRLAREISKRPDDPSPRCQMGQAAIEGGMRTLALQCFQAALDIDPKYPAALEALAALRAEPETAPAPASGYSKVVPRR